MVRPLMMALLTESTVFLKQIRDKFDEAKKKHKDRQIIQDPTVSKFKETDFFGPIAKALAETLDALSNACCDDDGTGE